MDILETVSYWSEHPFFDEDTRKAASRLLLEENRLEREECFSGMLEFGTGGMRGPMGTGTNRMNSYTVMRATEGLARVIKNYFEKSRRDIAEGSSPAVVIGYDSRHSSWLFAEVSAEVLCAYGIQVFLFSEIVPTPLVSCELLRRSASSAIIITASHNPPEDNGYKVYWSHGGQIVSPIDNLIIEEIETITRIDKIPRMSLEQARRQGLLQDLNDDADRFYFSQVEKLSWGRPEENKDYGVVYTPLHGTGSRLVPDLLKRRGFMHLRCVEEQMKADGKFPTLVSPNPEDPRAFEMALAQAEAKDDLIIANDPDADRLGVMVRDEEHSWKRLDGNQIGVLLLDYVLSKMHENGDLPRKALVVVTAVSSRLPVIIASSYGLEVVETLTGFKWIRDAAVRYEKTGQGSFVFGMEESHGYLCGTYTGDKDGVWSALAFAEMGASLKSKGKNILQQLQILYRKHGAHLDALETLTLKGVEGTLRIEGIMEGLRRTPPRSLGGCSVLRRTDLLRDEQIECGTGKVSKGPGLPASNVILLELEGGSRVIARPSGTEPKIKFYFNLCGNEMKELESVLLDLKEDFKMYRDRLQNGSATS